MGVGDPKIHAASVASASVDTNTNTNINTTPQHSTSFTSLFLSLTRPLPMPPLSSTGPAPTMAALPAPAPYTILFQHTHKFPQRLVAAEPPLEHEIVVHNNNNFDHSHMMMTPKQRCGRDVHGGTLFIHRAWEECVKRCEGNVILVKCLDHCFSFGSGSGGGGDKTRSENESGGSYWNMFERNGVVIDLYSDPLGWDDDADNAERIDSDSGSGSISVKTIKGCSSKLHSIASAIDEAVQYIHNRNCSHIHKHGEKRDGDRNRDDHDHDHLLQRPIPVIFDSITPILMNRGVEKLTILLTHLKQKTRAATTTMTVPTPIPSPIFLPCLIETLPLSSHRILEEYADAVLTLQSGKLFIAKRSARAGGMVCGGLSGGMRLTKEVQLFDIEYCYNAGGGGENHHDHPRLKLWTKSSKGDGMSSSGGEGGGAERDNQSGNAAEKGNDKGNGDGEVDGGVKEISAGMKTLNATRERNNHPRENTKHNMSQSSQLQRRHNQRPILEHQSDEQKRPQMMTPLSQNLSDGPSHSHSKSNSHQQPSRPRIYLEENDPEFDDFDEEDPDDDLDI